MSGVRDAGLTSAEAAAWFGVAPSTVRGWITTHSLEPIGKRGRANLYSFRALSAIDLKTRKSGKLRIPRFAQQDRS